MSLALWGYQLGRTKKGRARRSAQSSSHRCGAQVALQRCPTRSVRRGAVSVTDLFQQKGACPRSVTLSFEGTIGPR
jgi:hypothetical protein